MSISSDTAKAIAQQAYIYGLPMVENYRVMYTNAIAKGLGYNRLTGQARLYTPTDRVVPTPNNDTAYSNSWVDIRQEPMVLTIPDVPPERYFSFQIVDYFTNVVDYIGTRGKDFGGGSYLFVGPNWNGKEPPGIRRMIRMPGHLFFLLGRTRILGPNDTDAAQAIMDQYKLQTLSDFEGHANHALPGPKLVQWNDSILKETTFFQVLNQCLTEFQPPPECDATLLQTFAQINVGPGLNFNDVSPDLLAPIMEGAQQAYAAILNATQSQGDAAWSMPAWDTKTFGNSMDDYMFRATVSLAWIYMNAPAEAMYATGVADANSNAFDGKNNKYTMTFPNAPPVDAFWSLTMYDQDWFLVQNDAKRYSIGSSSALQKQGDAFTLYLQNEWMGEPGNPNPNWLPAPAGKFYLVLRLYCPNSSGITSYQVPSVQKVTTR